LIVSGVKPVMKICVLGFEGGAPQVIFRDERLTNLRRLMDTGVYGLLESVVPPTSIPAWISMSTSRDPGSIGVYGVCNRADYSYNAPVDTASKALEEIAIWDHLASTGKRSILLGVPPDCSPRVVNGEMPAFAEVLREFPDKQGGVRKDLLPNEVMEMSSKQWEVARHVLETGQWDYFHFVEQGLDHLQHGFWKHFDEKHLQFKPENPSQNLIPAYYQWLDEQVGAVFEVIDDETILLVASAYGAQRLDGVFAMNQWLIQEGLLVLHQYPSIPTPFEELKVDWNKTKVWSEGDTYARIFFNLEGREPQGIIPPQQRDAFQEELKARLEKLSDNEGRSLLSLVFKPKEIYRNVRGIAPDLMVSLGGGFWRSIGSVGHPAVCLPEESWNGGGCNHAEYGFFILAAQNCPLRGEFEGARLLDLAPTVLDLAGYDIPASMQGKSLVAGMQKKTADGGPDDSEAQRLIHDRLAGLGYI
jgi:predicted AlkP superfamily phosphohydrolase/phosphomutase